MTRDETSRAPQVPARAMQGAGAKTLPGRRAKPRAGMLAEASIWTERMVSALVNGVKGGKWYSVVDKVYVARAHSTPPGRKSGRTRVRAVRGWAKCVAYREPGRKLSG